MATAEKTGSEGIPLTDIERRIWSDIEWAQQNVDVQRDYAGEWVAIYERKVVAHGKDRDRVVREATEAMQRPAREFAVWPVVDCASLLSDSPLLPPVSW